MRAAAAEAAVTPPNACNKQGGKGIWRQRRKKGRGDKKRNGEGAKEKEAKRGAEAG